MKLLFIQGFNTHEKNNYNKLYDYFMNRAAKNKILLEFYF